MGRSSISRIRKRLGGYSGILSSQFAASLELIRSTCFVAGKNVADVYIYGVFVTRSGDVQAKLDDLSSG